MTLSETSFAFVDTETTGGNPVRDRVIEVAVILVDGNKVTRKWSTLLQPERSIPPMISAITGITNRDLEDAPRFRDIAEELFGLLEGRVFVAHNARFDYGFLKNEFRRLEREWTAKTLCTVRLSRALYPKYRNHNLDQLIERFGFPCDSRHRALDDTKVVTDFWFHAQKDRGEDQFSWCVQSLLKRPSLPSQLAATSIDTLPERTGVYLFYGKGSRPLYIGKSVDIRSRVLSHFSGDHQQRKDMEISQKLRRIEYRETVGELGALLLESRLIKQHLPLHNVTLRRVSGQCAVRLQSGEDGFERVAFVGGSDIHPSEFGSLYGVFRSARSAQEKVEELAEAYGLCTKKLGIERTGSGEYCFSYHLKKCKGACAGEEESSEHNLRLRLALSGMKHTVWPFDGPIGIRETHALTGQADIHIVDNWCFIATVKSEEELEDAFAGVGELQFDIDAYRIIAGFLRKAKISKRVHREWTIEILQFERQGEAAVPRRVGSRTLVTVP